MNKKDIRVTSLKFRTLASQMLKVDSQEEINFIKMFYDFISENRILRDYVDKCHICNYDFEKIFQNKPWHEPLVLPSDEKELIDYMYQLIGYIVESNQLLHFCYGYTNSTKFKDIISSFMRKVIEPFIEQLKNYLEICYVECEDDLEAKKENLKTIFLSYCQKDSVFADILEKGLKPYVDDKIKISRDVRDVRYHESFKKFMQSIEEHDYVIMIISDNYLKSRNCMFECLEVIKDNKFNEKLIYIIISDEDQKYYENENNISSKADIYGIDGGYKYISYWKEQEKILLSKIQEINDPAATLQQSRELGIVKKIIIDLPDFFTYLKDRNGFSMSKHIDNEFKDIISFMKLV